MDNKHKCLCMIAILLALIAYSTASSITSGTNNFFNNTTSFQGSSITLFLHDDNTTGIPYSSKDMRRSFDPLEPVHTQTITPANGNTSIQNWTSDALNVIFIPAGIHTLHMNAFKTGGGAGKIDKLFYQCGYVTSDGGNLTIKSTSENSIELTSTTQEIFIDMLMEDQNINSTDRMFIDVWVNQVGSGANPTVTLQYDDLTDSRLIFPATQQDITGLLNTKVNKSGDTMTGTLKGIIGSTECNFDISIVPTDFSCTNTTHSSTISIQPGEIQLLSGNGSPTGIKIVENDINASSNLSMNTNYIRLLSPTLTNIQIINETGNAAAFNTDPGTDTFYSKFTPDVSTNLTVLSINIQGTSGGAKIQMGIYDNSTPKVKLMNTSNQTATTGWNNFTISPLAITAGTSYYVAFQPQNVNVQWKTDVTSGGSYYSGTSFGFMPNTVTFTGTTPNMNARVYGNITNSSILYCLSVTYSGNLITTPC